jgi:hypothetical protein
MNIQPPFSQTEIDFLRSLSDSALTRILGSLERSQQIQVMAALMGQKTLSPEADRDLERKRTLRNKAAEIFIPPPADIDRRLACLADPERFLRTYGRSIFYNPFAQHHRAMIRAIWERSKTGGDKAIAAPRGDGKTQIALWMIIAILLACRVSFPVIIAATRKSSQKIFRQIQRTFASNELLIADFPEICVPVLELDGAPQRAAKQHVGGEKTRIMWTQDEIGFPYVPGSPYGGRYLTYFGLDSAIRGVHFNGVRPDFALIDDPETHEVAKSETQHFDIEEMIDGDVALLAGPDKQMTRVVLTTIQNRRCYSFRVTDRTLKPTFAGDRFGMLEKWPDRLDLWQEYIAIRQRSQADGDKDGFHATQFYLQNEEVMREGAVVSNPYRFAKRFAKDGSPIEVDALQAFFNKVADLGMSRVNAELQNDPDLEDAPETIGLTAGKVASRISGLEQNVLPKTDGQVFVGLDVGKYFSHWTKIFVHGNAIGHVIDYGILETPGMASQTTPEAVEVALLKALLGWRTDIFANHPPTFCLIDSGDYTGAVYEFIRQVNGVPFAASKGYSGGKFHLGEPSATRRLFDQCWAGLLPTEQIWLYHVNTEHWKQQVHERFATATFNDQQQLNDGSLSLYASRDPKKHLTFSHHIVAEERRDQFIEGKGTVRKWVTVSRNNHWLDATALALAASGIYGHRLIQATIRTPQPVAPQPRPSQTFSNQRFKQREGGWIPRRK